MTLRLRYSVRSHVGRVREGNEDSAYAGSRLALVADGMGGHAAGEVASSAVVATLAQLDEDEAGLDLLEVLSAAVQAANDHLRELVDSNSALDGMGTTLTAVLSSGSRLGLAHVGDSRAYLFRDGEFSQLTHDQTLVQRMVDEGRITAEQAETHPQRSLLTQALDGRAGVQPDLSVREARRGDRYLLCSDGLSGYVPHDTIAEALALPDADEAAEKLINFALQAGAPDNVTVVVADVVDDEAGLPDTPIVGGAAAEQAAVPSAQNAVVLPGGASLTPDEREAKRAARRRKKPAPPPEEYFAETPPDAPGRPVDTGVFRRPISEAEPPESAPGAVPVDTVPTVSPPPNAPPPGAIPPPPPDGAQLPLDATPPSGIPPVVETRSHRRSRRDLGRKPWYRRFVPLATIGAFIVLVAAVLITWVVASNSWYVARDGDNAALYHGIQSAPLGVHLSSVDKQGVAFNHLTSVDQSRVDEGIPADSRADGLCILARLKYQADALAYQTALRAQRESSPSPSPSPTKKPSASPSPFGSGGTKTSSAPSPSPRPRPSVSLPPSPSPLPKSCPT